LHADVLSALAARVSAGMMNATVGIHGTHVYFRGRQLLTILHTQYEPSAYKLFLINVIDGLDMPYIQGANFKKQDLDLSPYNPGFFK